MTAALTLHLAIRPLTGWLFLSTAGLVVLGFAGMLIAGWLDGRRGAIVPMVVCSSLAAVVAVLALGSML